jgi:hypothetical protein
MHVTRKRGTCPTKPDQRRRHRSRGSLHLTFKHLRNPFCHSAEMQGCIAIFKLFPRSLYTVQAQSRDVQFLRTWIAASTPRAHDPALSLIAHHPRTHRISQTQGPTSHPLALQNPGSSPTHPVAKTCCTPLTTYYKYSIF